MRQSVAAIALIRREENGRTLYLTRWNPRSEGLNLVGGPKEPGESFRTCLIREVGEALGLAESADFRVAPGPLAHLDFQEFSRSAQQIMAHVLEVFEVSLVGDFAPPAVADDSQNRWVSRDEIRARQCADGTPISPTAWRILSGLGER